MRQKTQIDFSQYRSAELVDTIAEIISLPNALFGVIKWAFIGLCCLAIAVYSILAFNGNLNLLNAALFEAYAIPAGLIGGVAFGISNFVRRSLDNMSKLVDLLFNVTKQIAGDVTGLSTGDKEMPATRDLVDDVYHHVILHCLKSSTTKIFGIFGMPVYWLYYLTLNRMVRYAIAFIPKAEANQIAKETIQAVAEAESDGSKISTVLIWAQKQVQAITGKARWVVLMPCYLILSAIVVFLLSPLAVGWILFRR